MPSLAFVEVQHICQKYLLLFERSFGTKLLFKALQELFNKVRNFLVVNVIEDQKERRRHFIHSFSGNA